MKVLVISYRFIFLDVCKKEIFKSTINEITKHIIKEIQ